MRSATRAQRLQNKKGHPLLLGGRRYYRILDCHLASCDTRPFGHRFILALDSRRAGFGEHHKIIIPHVVARRDRERAIAQLREPRISGTILQIWRCPPKKKLG